MAPSGGIPFGIDGIKVKDGVLWYTNIFKNSFHKVAIDARLLCSPCVSAYNHRRSPCTNNVCMQSISVEQVWTTCQELLQAAEGELF